MTNATLTARQIAGFKAAQTRAANGGHRAAALKAAETKRARILSTGECDAACMGAMLDVCECACEGANHGILHNLSNIEIDFDDESEDDE